MSIFVHSFSSRHILCLERNLFEKISDLKQHLLKEKNFPPDAYFFVSNGKIVGDDDPVVENQVYHTHCRILGGKGGFGSMLRAIGAQIEKTTNHEACRDLSGRRMRDVNNEKDLKDWLAKQAEREREREERRQQRIARRRAMPNHKFDDPLYDKQKALLSENQEEALLKGLKKTMAGASDESPSTSTGSRKRKPENSDSSSNGKKKKTGVEWLGVDVDLSDLDSDGDENSEEKTAVEPDSSPSDSSESGSSNDDAVVENRTEDVDRTDICNKDSEISEPFSETPTDTSGQCSESVEKSDSSIPVDALAAQNKTEEEVPFVLEEVKSVEELYTLGLDKLKAELMGRGVKCGGTLEERAARLFSVKGLCIEEIDPLLLAKSKNGKNVKNKK